MDWLKLSGNDHSLTTLDSCEKRPVKIACGIEGDSAVTLEEGAGGGGMGGTVAGLVLDVMAGVLLVVTVVGAIVPVGDTLLVVAAGIKQDVTVHVGGCTLHVTVAGTFRMAKWLSLHCIPQWVPLHWMLLWLVLQRMLLNLKAHLPLSRMAQ